MPLLTLTSTQGTGQVVSAEMFGANAVFERTEDGTPSAHFADAARVLDVPNIRFGGGQADLDPFRPDSGGNLPQDGETYIDITRMDGGELRPELVNFLDWCVDSSLTGAPVSATLIVPTKHLDVAAYADYADEITAFVQTVTEAYPGIVTAFQIGNEYWEMGETAYGQKASIAAVAIERGLDAAGVSEAARPDILVQMATAGNNGSEFGPAQSTDSFAARTEAADWQIIDQLSSDARDAIDGVTEHYYYNRADHAFPEDRSDLRSIDRDFSVWDRAFDKPLDLHITEWNIRTTAEEQHGLVAASTMLRQFENMIDLGVDSAHVWTLDYHSRTALTLDSDNGVALDGAGRLTNSAHGAVFDRMAETLVGKELVTASFDGAWDGIDISAYASATEVVFYISSRTLEVTDLSLDLLDALPAAGRVEAVQIGLDPASVNGRQWLNGEDADSVMIDGMPYYYNEHDADVVLTDMLFDDPGNIALVLKPFEVVELVVSLTPSERTPEHRAPVVEDPPAGTDDSLQDDAAAVGTSGNDTFALDAAVSKLSGGDGTDTLVLDCDRDDVTVMFNGYGWAEVHDPMLSQPLQLDSIERLAFDDGTLALDTAGDAGQAYRLYQASFDRTPDQPGLAFWIGQLDSGVISLIDAAEHFLSSLEFQQTYGRNESLGDEAFLDLLYLNVLNRSPDAAGYAFWRAQQDAGLSRADMLVSFSESVENKANVAGQIDDGIWL